MGVKEIRMSKKEFLNIGIDMICSINEIEEEVEFYERLESVKSVVEFLDSEVKRLEILGCKK